MNKKRIVSLRNALIKFGLDFIEFSTLFYIYGKKKVLAVVYAFESNKNILVKFFLTKRGRYNRPFLHITAIFVLGIGVLVAPFLADTYPIFSQNNNALQISFAQDQEQSIAVDKDIFQTEISQKPRSTIITYQVEKGDTLSTVAQKFDISVETIKWANDLKSDDLTIGDELKILPVTGIAYKVSKGDNVYTIAKKYSTNPQQIVDFPFNDFANPETFSLVEGQILIVPDGVKPSEKPVYREIYIAQGPVSISAAGFTWPLRGTISQFSSWYHTALDITSSVGMPVVAGQNGTVVKVNVGSWDGGYGTNLAIDNGAGYQSLYAHLSGINVNLGDEVEAGKTVIGWVGMTGRTTGFHLHFEIRRGGVLINPLSILQ